MPTESFNKYVFNLEEEGTEAGYRFQNSGYETYSFVLNTGLVIWFFFLWIIGASTVIILAKPVVRMGKYVIRAHKWISKTIFYSFLLRLFLEGYFEIMVSAFLNIRFLRWNTSGEQSSSILTLCYLFLFSAFPPVVLIMLLKCRPNFRSSKFRQKYGVIYAGLNQTSPKAVLFHFYFLVRRAAFAFSLVYFEKMQVVQCFTLSLGSLATLCYLLAVHPFEKPEINTIEIINEATVLVLT